MREVLVTGIGVVSPFGVGCQAFLEGLKGAKTAAKCHVKDFDGTILEGLQAGEIPGLSEAAASIPGKTRKFMSEATLLGCLAGREAWETAALEDRVPSERIGIFAASGLTSADHLAAEEMLALCVDATGMFSPRLLGERGLAQMNPLHSFKILPNMPPCILAMLLGIRGPNLVFNPSEDQAAAALLEGVRAVAEGEADAALVGAADAPSSPPVLAFLHQSGRLQANEWASPGAAYLVLECGPHPRPLARITFHSGGSVPACRDPLAQRLGRTFAAAPALALATACLWGSPEHLLAFPGLKTAFHVERTL